MSNQAVPMSTSSHKMWIEQCRVAEGFGMDALRYLISEKLFRFVSIAEDRPEYARELPAFVAQIRRQFTAEELSAYLTHLWKTKYRYYRPPCSDNPSLESLGRVRELNHFFRIRQLLDR